MNLRPLSGTRAYVMQFSNPKMVPLLQARKPSLRNHHWTTVRLFTKPLWWLNMSQMKKLSGTKSLMYFRKGVLSPRCPNKTSSSSKWWSKEISRRWIILTSKGKCLWNELKPWSRGNPNRILNKIKKEAWAVSRTSFDWRSSVRNQRGIPCRSSSLLSGIPYFWANF